MSNGFYHSSWARSLTRVWRQSCHRSCTTLELIRLSHRRPPHYQPRQRWHRKPQQPKWSRRRDFEIIFSCVVTTLCRDDEWTNLLNIFLTRFFKNHRNNVCDQPNRVDATAAAPHEGAFCAFRIFTIFKPNLSWTKNKVIFCLCCRTHRPAQFLFFDKLFYYYDRWNHFYNKEKQ